MRSATNGALGLVILSCALAGCSSDESFEPVDGACGDIEVPAAPEPVAAECFGGDTECPPDWPEIGVSCGAPRTCTYDGEFPFECADGRWSDASAENDSPPPFTEMCLAPFDGTVDGAELLIGPASSGPFRPFSDCEEHDLVWGPQGGAMIAFQLRVVGADAPDCVGLRTQLSVGEHEGTAADNRVALHCGQSMLVYAVVPWDLQRDLCGAPDTVVMKPAVEVPGIGSTFARVRVPTPGDCGGGDDG